MRFIIVVAASLIGSGALQAQSAVADLATSGVRGDSSGRAEQARIEAARQKAARIAAARQKQARIAAARQKHARLKAARIANARGRPDRPVVRPTVTRPVATRPPQRPVAAPGAAGRRP